MYWDDRAKSHCEKDPWVLVAIAALCNAMYVMIALCQKSLLHLQILPQAGVQKARQQSQNMLLVSRLVVAFYDWI